MRATVAILAILALSASMASANHLIGLYADQNGSSCELQWGEGETVQEIYVIYEGTGFQEIIFSTLTTGYFEGGPPDRTFAAGPFLQLLPQEPADPYGYRVGPAFSVWDCMPQDLGETQWLVGTLTLTATGPPLYVCASVYLVTYFTTEEVFAGLVTECDGAEVWSDGFVMRINPGGTTCESCGSLGAVAVDGAAWGRIKALYR